MPGVTADEKDNLLIKASLLRRVDNGTNIASDALAPLESTWTTAFGFSVTIDVTSAITGATLTWPRIESCSEAVLGF